MGSIAGVMFLIKLLHSEKVVKEENEALVTEASTNEKAIAAYVRASHLLTKSTGTSGTLTRAKIVPIYGV